MTDPSTTYRTAGLPPPMAPTPDALLAAQTLASNVVVPVLQNIGGGVGVFLLALIGALISGAQLTLAAKIALGVAGVAFAVAMIVRAFRDEVRYIVATWAAAHDRQTQAALQAQLAELQAELARIHSAELLATRYDGWALAERMLREYYDAKLDITRAPCLKRGWTRKGWETAGEILRGAQVTTPKGAIDAPTFGAAWSRVVRYMAASGRYVRAADGGFAKV